MQNNTYSTSKQISKDADMLVGFIFVDKDMKFQFYSFRVLALTSSQSSSDSNENSTQEDMKLPQAFVVKSLYESTMTFKGMSPDGNELYINTNSTNNITRWRRCVDGKYVSGSECMNCSTKCKTCFGSPNRCTSCVSSQQFFSNNTCMECN